VVCSSKFLLTLLLGSVHDIMRYKYPEGIQNEEIIATILKNMLLGMQYFHSTNQIHRDLKAANILISGDGRIQIADFGLSAHLVESGDRVKNRLTFVGVCVLSFIFNNIFQSFCWMAPEVLKQDVGYDYKADIWSFGITALELAYGQAPYAEFPPMKVMFTVLESPPPMLVDLENHKWGKRFREMVEMCLQKDPTKRPTAAQLLKHKFFSQAVCQICFVF
jgi:serine/threonine-protein kinase OSR1/STK39